MSEKSRVQTFVEVPNSLSRFAPIAYAGLRILLGVILITHGYPKLMREAHGSVADPFTSVQNLVSGRLHLPFPLAFAVLITALEVGGGLFLLIGLASRVIAITVAIEMFVISFGIYAPKWAWTDHGMEYPFLMGVLALYLACRGAGAFSVDALVANRGISRLASAKTPRGHLGETSLEKVRAS